MRKVIFFVLLIFAILMTAGCANKPIPTASASRVPTVAEAAVAKPTATPIVAPVAPTFPPPTRNPQTRVLRINLGVHADILDPQRASASGEIAILQLAYEGLTRVDEKGRVLPGAAESWDFSSDAKSVTFRLRAGLKRADGTPLTAKDFEFAFRHALDPRVTAQSASLLDEVKGAIAAYSLDPKVKLEDIEKTLDNIGVKAVDDRTLAITFDQPASFFSTIASTWVVYPPDRSKLEKDPEGWWKNPDNHNGNGPFKIIEISDQVIKMTPNPNYWNGRAKIDRIEFYWIPDAAALDSYRNGELDITRVALDNFPQAQATPALGKEFYRAPSARVTYFGFNLKRAPFTDKNVRKAFSQALDREGFARDVLKGAGRAYLSWIPPGVPGSDDMAVVPGYDPSAAVQTLIDAGYGTPDKKRVDCAKLGTVKLTYINTPRNQLLFLQIAGSLTRVFACQVLLDPVEANAYSVVVRDPKTTPQVYLMSWEQEYAHPFDWLFLQTCSGVFATRLGYCNRDFDAALLAANQESNFDRAVEKYRAAQKIFVADLAGAFLWNNDQAYLVKPYILGPAEHFGSSDFAWIGQYGNVLTYDVDITKVGTGYPTQ
jgi:oligopeptide transport system substrate-binding protein